MPRLKDQKKFYRKSCSSPCFFFSTIHYYLLCESYIYVNWKITKSVRRETQVRALMVNRNIFLSGLKSIGRSGNGNIAAATRSCNQVCSQYQCSFTASTSARKENGLQTDRISMINLHMIRNVSRNRRDNGKDCYQGNGSNTCTVRPVGRGGWGGGGGVPGEYASPIS